MKVVIKSGRRQKFGTRVPKGISEKKGIRIPFGRAVALGHVKDWEGSLVFKQVPVSENSKESFQLRPDLILLRQGRLGIVECKRDRSGDARHGMISQVLLYCEMVSQLGHARLVERLKTSAWAEETNEHDRKIIEKLVKSLKADLRFAITPILVVDRWGSKLNKTSSLVINRINLGLSLQGLQPVVPYALTGEAPVSVELE